MAISGRPTLLRPPEPAPRRRRAAGALFALPILLGACSPSFHAGTPPPIDRLAGLTLGASTSADVSAKLGAPPGHGAAGLPDGTSQDMWVYESQDAEGSVSHLAMLFVFVDPQSGVFNGYLWFRSGRIIEQTR